MYSLLPDEFAFDPRVVKAGPEATALYVRALARVAQTLSDGLLTRADVQMLCVYDAPCVVSALDLAAVLVSVGLWEISGSGWRVVDYLAHNMSAAQYAEWRKKQAAGGRRGGAMRAQSGSRDRGGRWLPESSPETTLDRDRESRPDSPRPRPSSSKRYRLEADSDESEWDAWQSPQWQPFLEEWKRRFRRPPTSRQRETLWDVIDSRPMDAGVWVGKAPAGIKAAAVVGHVLDEWRRFKGTQQSPVGANPAAACSCRDVAGRSSGLGHNSGGATHAMRQQRTPLKTLDGRAVAGREPGTDLVIGRFL